MLAALHVLAALGGQDGTLCRLVAEYDRYVGCRRDQLHGRRPGSRLAAIKAAYEGREGVTIDELDGLTVTLDDSWFNVPPPPTRNPSSA